MDISDHGHMFVRVRLHQIPVAGLCYGTAEILQRAAVGQQGIVFFQAQVLTVQFLPGTSFKEIQHILKVQHFILHAVA